MRSSFREMVCAVPPGRREGTYGNGFTLIEILVAMSLLAVSLVVILQLFSGGLKSGKVSDEYTRGIFHAREVMEEVLLLDAVEEGVTAGEFDDGFKWKTEIVLLEQREEEAARLPFDTFTIAVEVSWGEEEREKHLRIDTLKVFEKVKATE